ncbi:MAG TPA: hypothetical protein VN837_04200 [Chloroflexota bacterium]|nr:hypothetical protein [Chloroflexota bacterium]
MHATVILMSKPKKPRALAVVKEITPEIRAQAAGPRFRKRCPLCKRPQDDPEAYSRADRLLSTVLTNPVVAFMRMHNYAGKGSVPEISEQFMRFLDHRQKLTTRQANLAVAVLTDYAHPDSPYGAVAPLVFEVEIKGRSYRSLMPQFGVDDHTLAKMVNHQRPILRQLCHEAGVLTLALEE